MQNYPYTTQWKDGKPIVPPTKNTSEKNTLDPLQKASINMTDDSPWCLVCQLPHSPKYCVVDVSFFTSQNEDEERSNQEENVDNYSAIILHNA